MNDPSPDTSGVKLPPPLLFAGAFVASYVAHRLVPMQLWPALTGVERWLAWIVGAAATLLLLTPVYLFLRAGTTPNPTRPTTTLVIRGPYRFTRNPMYLGMTALYCAGILLLGDLWPIVLLPVVLRLMQQRVIAREEAYLERTFGDAYRSYKARVRRWL